MTVREEERVLSLLLLARDYLNEVQAERGTPATQADCRLAVHRFFRDEVKRLGPLALGETIEEIVWRESARRDASSGKRLGILPMIEEEPETRLVGRDVLKP
ncbi:hypothetical protein HQ520_10795 [bacterium]|nr:hypothetical protein [bacterium]